MLTGDIRSQIDGIWNDFWSGGVSNPLSVIEQITYLLFIKRLDELHTVEERKATQLGIPNLNVFGPTSSGLPRIDITGLNSLGVDAPIPALRYENSFQWVDNFSYYHGKHSLKFGADIHRFRGDFFQISLESPRGHFGAGNVGCFLTLRHCVGPPETGWFTLGEAPSWEPRSLTRRRLQGTARLPMPLQCPSRPLQ